MEIRGAGDYVREVRGREFIPRIDPVPQDLEYVVVDTDKAGGLTPSGCIYEGWDQALARYRVMLAEIYPNGDPYGALVIFELRLVHSGEYRGEGNALWNK